MTHFKGLYDAHLYDTYMHTNTLDNARFILEDERKEILLLFP